MHGEYKVPGGKLVAVDLDVEDGALCNVNVSGDFFLEPDTALKSINRALDGLARDASPEAMQQAIQAALPEATIMFGFEALDVARAVQRALSAEPE